jgi:hypothetical protein
LICSLRLGNVATVNSLCNCRTRAALAARAARLLAGDAADVELRFVARELCRCPLLVDLRLLELGASDVLLRCPLAETEIGELRLSRLQLLLRLP